MFKSNAAAIARAYRAVCQANEKVVRREWHIFGGVEAYLTWRLYGMPERY